MFLPLRVGTSLNQEVAMPRIKVTLRGTNGDHNAISTRLSAEEVEDQLTRMGDALNTNERVRLPWATFLGSVVIAAQQIPNTSEAGSE
jgi:hypothetical protein